MLDTNGAPMPLSAMAFAPSDRSGQIYAFGTEDGQLRITTDGGANWTDLDSANAGSQPLCQQPGFQSGQPERSLRQPFPVFNEDTPGSRAISL